MKFLVAGTWRDTGRRLEVRNPYDGSLVGTVSKADLACVEEALTAAAAYDHRLGAWERYEILHRYARTLADHTESYAELISRESGKTLRDARIEVHRSHQTFLLAAEEAKRIHGELLPLDAVAGMPDLLSLVVREPIGPVVAICPFNYPLNLVAHKVGPALAANNAVVVKPSGATPLTALRMAEDLLASGLPAEMLHVLPGDPREIGEALVTDPRVAKVTFTGSVGVGKALAQKIGLKAMVMELSGNDPLLLLADADLDAAVPAAIDGAFGNNGERCTSIKRLIVEDAIADSFVERFVEETRGLRVGDPLAEDTDLGPLIDEAAALNVEERVRATIESGAKLLCGGRREGALYWPTILDHVRPDHPVVAEETFGPVAPIIRVRDFDEAIRIANDSSYGLQSGVFTRSLDRALEAARRIEAGAVMINKGPGFRAEHLPFGGIKDSGVGREGVRYAVEAMTRTKTIVFAPSGGTAPGKPRD